jgi:tRNA 2-(methylsulfanyl)-N6-isopentenyladenosine37 hydroxylase
VLNTGGMLCLRVPTDAAWTVLAMRDVGAVLVDQAYCEIKAASNALSLAARHPEDVELVRSLTDLAREEIDHFQRVLGVLSLRGLTLGRPPVDAYAAGLRNAVRALPQRGATPLVDRLLVGALIEARSCERFKLLANATRGDDAHSEVHALWDDLLASEARHYRTFLDMAVRVAGDRAQLSARLELLAKAEGELVRTLAKASDQASRATVHG